MIETKEVVTVNREDLDELIWTHKVMATRIKVLEAENKLLKEMRHPQHVDLAKVLTIYKNNDTLDITEG